MNCLWCGERFTPTNKGQIVCEKDRTRAAKIPLADRVAAAKEAARNVDKP
jgi:hypothetical protein